MYNRVNSLGYESWVASCKEILHLGKYFEKNTIIFVDSDQKNIDKVQQLQSLQDLIELVNPRAYIVRIQPHNMWLNSEFIESIIDNLSGNYTSQLLMNVKFSQRHSQENHLVPYLQRVQINIPRNTNTTNNNNKSWDIERIQIILQKLFSKAVLSNTIEPKEFKIPNLKQSLKGIQLALFVAKIKVFSQRQKQNGLIDFQNKLSQLDENSLKSIEHGILSFSANISNNSSSSTTTTTTLDERNNVCIEASIDSIIIRSSMYLFEKNQEKKYNCLNIIGCFTSSDVQYLKSLFEICVPFKLQPKNDIEFNDVSKDLYSSIEKTYNNIALPSGWWYDGLGYIDIHGTRLPHRPDINHLINYYIQDKNNEIHEYNKILESIEEYL